MSDPLDRLSTALADRYTIEQEIGAGGMATVYLAHDLKHDRQVAVKVLRPELAAVLGAERFLNEIKVTANLQHPHILPLYDSGEAQGFLYYVMPYVVGESLRAKLNREKQLGIEEAVRITTEVADALDYAHRHNVIHRDIKPENILLHDGRPMVADFGIALAVTAAGRTRLTETGLSLGTPQYMSPEQATGDRELDGRSDIYSLACVLYEMLSGEPPHTGPTVQAVIAKVVTDRPRAIMELRDTVPAHVAATLEKALAKLPADRFARASELIAAIVTPGAVALPATGAAVPAERRPLRGLVFSVFGWVLTIVLLAIVAYGGFGGGPDGDESAVLHLNIALPSSAPLALAGPAPIGIWQKALAVSRDSRTIVYVAPFGSTTRLHRRDLDDQAVTAIAGTEGAYHPFFSPDGQWIGFFSGLALKKVQVSGGQPVPLAQDLFTPVGAAWTDDGRILVADHEGRQPTWIPAAGGSAEVLDTVHAQFETPALIPGGRWAVGTLAYSGTLALLSLEDGALYAITREGLRSHSIPPQDRFVGYNPVYSPTGHLLYLAVADGVLMALPFDAERGEVLGDPVPVMTGVRKEEVYGFGHFAIGDDGTLIYAPGGNADFGYLAFVDPQGGVDTLGFPRALYESVHLSPDGERVALVIRSELGLRTPHVLDLASRRQEPLREMGVPNAWSTGEELVLAQRDLRQLSSYADVTKILYSLTDASSRPLDLNDPAWVAVARDADLIAWSTRRDRDIFVRPLRGEGDAVRIPEAGGQVSPSPDGAWVAYLRPADNTVRLSPFPPTGLTVPVSDGRGEQPRWTSGSERLVYRDGRRFFHVDVGVQGSSAPTSPRLLAEGPFVRVWGWSYDVARDGRLLVVLGSPERSVGHLNVVTNFFSTLRRLAPRD